MNPAEPRRQSEPGNEFAAIDRILANEEPLAPSSGFLDAVMERVREEEAVPKPIPFPWRRVAPGIALAAGVFGGAAFEFAPVMWQAMRQLAVTHPAVVLPSIHEPAGWTALALVAALAVWLFSRRMAGESGLL